MGKVSKRVLTGTLAAALAGAMLMLTGCGSSKNGSLQIEDTTLSNAVHDALGVDRTEELTKKQLDSITELDIGLLQSEFQDDYGWGKYLCDISMDLSEIGVLTNLETLTINSGCLNRIYGCDGLADCKKLKNLKGFILIENLWDNATPIGENELLQLIENCKSLETIDLGGCPPEHMLEEIHRLNTHLVVVGEPEEDERETERMAAVGKYRYSLDEVPQYIEEIEFGRSEIVETPYGNVLFARSTDDLEECREPEKVKAVYIAGDMREVDLEALKPMSNLQSLSIFGCYEYTNSVVEDLEGLKSLPNLHSLTLADLTDVDLSALKELKGLKYLSFINNDEELPTDLPCLEQLTDFTYLGNNNGIEDYLPSLKSVHRLKGTADTLHAYTSLTKAFETKEFSENLRELDLYINGDEIPNLKMADFNNLEHVRWISVENRHAEINVDLTGFKGLPELKVLSIDKGVKGDVICTDTSFSCPELRYLKLDIYKQMQLGEKLNLSGFSSSKNLSVFMTGITRGTPTMDENWVATDWGSEMLKSGVLLDFDPTQYLKDKD